MPTPREIRWGILATGGIAKTFTKDLLVDPHTRNVSTHTHTVVAAASSSSADRAASFLKDVGAPSSAKAYGSYAELVADADVEIVYVATPHSHHYQNARLVLEAGKHCLCEKAFTVNAAQAKALAALAREKGLFLMEAVWTRYFPLSAYVRDAITWGRIGVVERVFADNSNNMNPDDMDAGNRMCSPDLAGGALLDSGIYSLTWVFQTIYPLSQKSVPGAKPSVVSALKKLPGEDGVDEMVTMALTFPRKSSDGGDLQAIATTSIRISNDLGSGVAAGPNVRIQGTKGEIQVFPPAYRPTRTRIILEDGTVEDKGWAQPGPGKGSKWFNGFGAEVNHEGEGHGMFWEADEAGLALIEGRKEGRLEGLDESIVIMEIMDEVRKQGGLRYPEKIETTDYPVQL